MKIRFLIVMLLFAFSASAFGVTTNVKEKEQFTDHYDNVSITTINAEVAYAIPVNVGKVFTNELQVVTGVKNYSTTTPTFVVKKQDKQFEVGWQNYNTTYNKQTRSFKIILKKLENKKPSLVYRLARDGLRKQQ